MSPQTSPRSLLLALPALLVLSLAAPAAAGGTRAAVAMAAYSATRATSLSGPAPAELGAGRVLIAPTGEGPGEQYGNCVADAGDVNGDGYDDVIVGAWTSDAAAGDTGSAYVYFGGPGMDDAPDLILHGEGYRDNFGTSVAAAGDVNGDGYGDLIVGAYNSRFTSTRTGRAYVFFGGPVPDAVPDLVLVGEGFADHFGISVASAGDVNDDGYSDVVVGAADYHTGDLNPGRAYIYFGGAAPDAGVDLRLTGTSPSGRFGYAVASAGDLNADGFDDVVVGAIESGGTGRAYVFFGGPGLDAIPDRTFNGEAAGDRFGLAVASPGDVNGDGHDDLLVSAYLNDAGGTDAGRVYVFHGGPGVDTIPDQILTGVVGGEDFGLFVDGAGDLNGDGFTDVIVGAWLSDARGPDTGRAYIYFMGPGADGVADAILTGEAPGDRLGISVSGAGDLNADGVADVIVGAYFNDAGGADAGRAYVVTLGPMRPPVVTAPASVSGLAGTPISFLVTAADPDGDPIASLTAAPLPAGAAFAPNGSNTSGTFDWRPDFSQAGDYAVTFTASNALSGSATTAIHVGSSNRPPVLSVPAGVFGAEGVLISLPIAASDPDGDHVTLGALNRPVGSLFVDFGNNSGTFSWTPGFGQSGTYTATFTGRDDRGADAAPRDLTIVVDDVNRAPIAAPGGPYPGAVNVPITFNGTRSSDPDGTPLGYLWDFGDLATATGATPVHAYTAGGTFTVTLTVSDGSLTDHASTIATIRDIFPARAFTTPPNATIRLGSGKAGWCAEIEPVESAFLTTAVISSTIVMKYGSSQILAQAGKVSLGADKDANGIQELTACFAKTDLRTLFAGLPKGTNTVTVTLEGDLTTGGKFRAVLTVDVVSAGGGLAASLSPNPLNPQGTLTFRTSAAGRVRVSIFDLQGRRVRTLLDARNLQPGFHDVAIDGRSDAGAGLASSVYYYRIEAGGDVETGRFAIMK